MKSERNNPIYSAAVEGFRVTERRVFRGPHFYSDSPMILIQLDIGRLEQFPTNKIEGFAHRLEKLLPGLHDHGCSYGRPGGFIQRMNEGTWLGHVVEHVALELQNVAGCQVTRGKTRSVSDRPGVYNVMYTYSEEQVGVLAGRLALELVNSLLPTELQGIQGLDRIDEYPEADGTPFSFEAAINHLRERRRTYALGPTTASLVKEAERRGIPWMRLDDTTSLIQLGYGRRQKRIQASITSATSEIATEIAGDKDLTKKLLAAAGLPVPKGDYVRTVEDARTLAEKIGFPLVVKPLDGNHGRGVTTNIMDMAEIDAAFEKAQQHSRSVVLEQYYEGFDHRLLVVDGRLIAAAKRLPAHVVGDGVSTIERLVQVENANPWRGIGHESYLTKIPMEDSDLEFLKRRGLDLNSIPDVGETIYLQQTANLSSGGTAEDLTDVIHPENKAIAERAARAIGLDVAGIDFMVPDLTKSVLETGGGVIEVNACPGLRMHLRPTKGTPRNVARPIIQSLFPGKEDGRIPIIAVTGTNGKTTTTRMIGHIFQHCGLNVGLTSTTGIYFNGTRIAGGDSSGPKSAKMVLRDPTVDVAVLETARGGILREGLGFETCDVGVALNVAADHLGLRGINTVEDLAKVKSVVVEAVRSTGYSVLNADDPLTVQMERHSGGRTVYFSMTKQKDWPEFLKEHIEDGGLAVVCDQERSGCDIVVYDGGEIYPIAHSKHLPATFGGLAEFNVANALAAVAVAYVQDVSPWDIKDALMSFNSSTNGIPGRLNVFDGADRKVIVDYVHNPHGLRALGKFVSGLRAGEGRTIGVISIAGDRRDEDIREMGALAGEIFDDVIFREDADRRGREDGEIARILMEAAAKARGSEEGLQIVLGERESIEIALSISHPADLVILAVDEVEEAGKIVEECLRNIEQRALASRTSPLMPEKHYGNGNAKEFPIISYREAG